MHENETAALRKKRAFQANRGNEKAKRKEKDRLNKERQWRVIK